MNTITIILPLPPKSLSPNWRGHWSIKARDTTGCRTTALCRALTVLDGCRPMWGHSSLQATFYHAQNRRRDDDNLIASLKPYRDGLVDAGLMDDDCGVTTLPVVKMIDRDRPRVEITITERKETT